MSLSIKYENAIRDVILIVANLSAIGATTFSITTLSIMALSILGYLRHSA
jgi:hypothetical protein